MFIPRTLAETDGQPGPGAFARAAIVAGLIAVALFAVLAVTFTPGSVSLEEGDVAQEDIRAPSTVTFLSERQTAEAREARVRDVPSEYEPAVPPADFRERQLTEYNRLVARIGRVLERRDAATTTPEEAAAQFAEIDELSSSQVPVVLSLTAEQWQPVADAGTTVLEMTQLGEVHDGDQAEVRSEVRSRVTSGLAPELRELAGDLAAGFVEANYFVSEQATAAAQDAARRSVAPIFVSVRQGVIVVREGNQVTADDLEKLDKLGLTANATNPARLAGTALVAILIATLLVATLWRFQPHIWYRNRSLLLFGLTLLVTAVAIRIAGDRTLWAFVVPTSAAVLLIGILLGGYAGAAMAIALAVITGVVNREAFEPAVYVLAGGLVSLLAIVKAERLNAFVRAAVFLGLSNAAAVTAFSLLAPRDVAAVLQLIAAGLVNAALAAVLALGSFAMLGNLFGIMTVFQLLELANPSNRLLRRLLLETPGTYHHSVMVGNLAERAAETIGADSLMARVAAYYHDIGKMKNPLAFIENQAGSHNIHDDLSAETSARIIAGHIRDGIDLGYEHGLPVQIIGFIPQHHGTSVMSFFYGAALREAGGVEEHVNEATFRYPGPKPQSREAAILMLADGVEASVRSLDEKDEASIRGMVDRIVDGRVDDGQLDDAELTLKNISQIKEAFVQQLLGMYHSRIKYPDNVLPLDHREQTSV